MRKVLFLLLSVFFGHSEAARTRVPLIIGAPTDSVTENAGQSVRRTGPVKEQRWVFGLLGKYNVLDTYLSPFTYTGLGGGMFHRSEKFLRRAPAWSLAFQTSNNVTYTKSATDNSHELDLQVNLAYGALYNWRPTARLRLGLGALLGAGGGLTYITRGGNNPLQGRIGADLIAQGVAEYTFRLFGKDMKARLQTDAPLCGLAFAPRYGQSYYEIFALGHTERNLHFTHPFNAPTGRLLCTLDFPISRFTLSIGYHGEARQSNLGGLKRHVWSNTLVVGFVRRVQRVY